VLAIAVELIRSVALVWIVPPILMPVVLVMLAASSSLLPFFPFGGVGLGSGVGRVGLIGRLGRLGHICHVGCAGRVANAPCVCLAAATSLAGPVYYCLVGHLSVVRHVDDAVWFERSGHSRPVA